MLPCAQFNIRDIYTLVTTPYIKTLIKVFPIPHDVYASLMERKDRSSSSAIFSSLCPHVVQYITVLAIIICRGPVAGKEAR